MRKSKLVRDARVAAVRAVLHAEGTETPHDASPTNGAAGPPPDALPAETVLREAAPPAKAPPPDALSAEDHLRLRRALHTEQVLGEKVARLAAEHGLTTLQLRDAQTARAQVSEELAARYEVVGRFVIGDDGSIKRQPAGN